jgi:hypothetical protein
MSKGSAHDGRSHASSVTSATGDPHASLSLFAPRSDPEPTSTPKRPAPAPRTSARPPTRDLTDILAGNDDGADWAPPSPTQQGRPPSPRKNTNGGQQRAGANKNYHAIRLFGEEDPADPGASDKSVKTNPNKYKHFEFGYGEGAAPTQATTRAKHASQWDFADFVTPDKPRAKVRAHEVRHIAWSDDEVRPCGALLRLLTTAGRPAVPRAPPGRAPGPPGRQTPLRIHGQGRRGRAQAAVVAAQRLDGAVQGQRDQ